MLKGLWNILSSLNKVILVSVFLVSSLVETKQFLLASFPRSGSTFLSEMIAKSTSGNHITSPWYSKKKYDNSFTMTSDIFDRKYLKFDTKNKDKIFKKISQKDFDEIFFNQWGKTGFKGAKEVYLTINLPLFLKKFETTLLYRHRRYTFPSSAPQFILPVYESFIKEEYGDPCLSKIKKYVLSNTKSDVEKQCAAHMISWYLMLKYANEYYLPIVEWKKLLLLSKVELKEYFEGSFPEGIGNPDKMADLVVKARIGSFNEFWKKGYKPAIKYLWRKYIRGVNPFLADREDKYYALNVEDYNQKLLKYIREVDSDFALWQFLA